MPKNLFHNALLANILYLVAFNHLTHNKIHQHSENTFLDCGIPIKISTMEKGVSMPLECNIKRIETIIAENICLSEYLSGIEAFIDCSYKQKNFAKYLSDING